MSTSALRYTFIRATLSGVGFEQARIALLVHHALSAKPVLALPCPMGH